MPKAKVLIVEDNPMNMELAGDLLEAEGYEILRAATALEALGVLQEVKPDLILMDVQLPGLSGLDLTKRLKKDLKTHDVPIIAFTAYSMKCDQEMAFKVGCDGYISKPIDTKRFVGAIEVFLLGKRHDLKMPIQRA